MKIALNGFVASIAVALVAFLGGCGPQNINDESYLAQLNEAGLNQDGIMNKDAQDSDDNQDDAQPAEMDRQVMQPTKMVAPEIAKLPPSHLRAPTVVDRQPTVVLHSGEQRDSEREIHHWRTILKPQLTLTKHRVHHQHTDRHFYHTNVIHNPSTCTQVYHTHEARRTDEVVPTVETTSPVTVGCPGVCPGPRPYFGFHPGFYGRAYWVR